MSLLLTKKRRQQEVRRQRVRDICVETERLRAAIPGTTPVVDLHELRQRRNRALRWKRDGSAFICDDWTPDKVAERNEQLAWLMQHRRPWQMVNGQLMPGSHDRAEGLLADLTTEMQRQRGEWKGRMRDLAGVPTAAEGTYGALGAYPLAAELAAVTPTTTESGLLSAANAALFMPIPANGLLTPQAYRFVICGRTTTTATAANYTWTPRLGNANTSPSLGASAAIAKTISITNAIFILKGDMTIQSIGAPGTNSKAIGHFEVKLNSAAGGAYTAWAWGSTAQATFDASVAPGASANGGQVWVGVTASAAAADPFTVGQVHFMDWN